MNRTLTLAALLVAAGALLWALWPAGPVPSEPPGAPVSIDAGPTVTAPESAAMAPPSPPPLVTARAPGTEPPPDPAQPPKTRAEARHFVDQRAAPPPGGEPTNPDEAPRHKTGDELRMAAVKEAINKAKPAIVDCYEQALEESPELSGDFKVKFVVVSEDGVGKLKEGEVTEDGLNNPFLGMCALKAIASVEFDAEMDGEVVVNYPFKFRPSAEEGK